MEIHKVIRWFCANVSSTSKIDIMATSSNNVGRWRSRGHFNVMVTLLVTSRWPFDVVWGRERDVTSTKSGLWVSLGEITCGSSLCSTLLSIHHTFPWDCRRGELIGVRANLAASVIDRFHAMGWAYDLKSVSTIMVRDRARRTGDGSWDGKYGDDYDSSRLK